jgi:lysophospholipase L1-like esterase
LNWKSALSLFSLLLIPIVLGLTVWLLWTGPRLAPIKSDQIFLEAEWLGGGGHELLRDLDNAQIIVPARPHDPLEAYAEQLAHVSRRRTFSVSTNSIGLRHPEVTPKEGYRILCLGESVTFGWGVAASEAYPAQLSEILGVEVINAGIPAMRPSHMSEWLQRYASSLDADLILITFRPNWMHPFPWKDYFQSIRSAKLVVAPTPIAVILPPISTFDLRGNSQRPEELTRLRQRLRDIPWLDLTPAFRNALPASGVILNDNNGVQQMIDRQSGAVLVQATGPDPLTLAPEIVDALESDHGLAEPLMFDGAHPDEQGFLVFAQTVADFIKEQGWR